MESRDLPRDVYRSGLYSARRTRRPCLGKSAFGSISPRRYPGRSLRFRRGMGTSHFWAPSRHFGGLYALPGKFKRGAGSINFRIDLRIAATRSARLGCAKPVSISWMDVAALVESSVQLFPGISLGIPVQRDKRSAATCRSSKQFAVPGLREPERGS